MSKFILTICLIFSLVLGGTISAQDRASIAGEKQRVAILPMGAVKLADSKVFANVSTGVEEFAKAATDKVVNAFTNLKRFQVLDRGTIEQLMKEQDFQMSDMSDGGGSIDMGGFKGADIVCISQLQNVSATEQFQERQKKVGKVKSKGSKGKSKSTTLYGGTEKVSVGFSGSVEFQVKITNVSTGEVLLSKDFKGESGSSFFQRYEDSRSKAAFAALNAAESELKKKLKKLFPLEGEIVEIIKAKKGKELFLISLGKDLGLKEDDKLIVVEKIPMEVQGKQLTREKEVGRIKVKKLTTDGVFAKAAAYKNGSRIVKKIKGGAKLVVVSK